MSATQLPVAEAARWLRLSESTLQDLIRAGFIATVADGSIPTAELKAFSLRNAEGGAAAQGSQSGVDVGTIISALDAEIEQLSGQAYEIFSRAVPAARQWKESQRNDFVKQAQGRFGAVLAVTAQGAQVDDALRNDLEEVGAGAAWAGSSLVHMLAVLRISRDLLVQRAMTMADEQQGWAEPLKLFITRLMPSIDRITDAISAGFFRALNQELREQNERMTEFVNKIPYGVYEADMDGLVSFANDAFGVIVGTEAASLQGMALGEVIRPVDGSNTSALLSEPEGDVGQYSVDVQSSGGDKQSLEIDVIVRRRDGLVEGFFGVVRVHSSASLPDLAPLARHAHELRRSLEILRDAGSYMQGHSEQLDSAQILQAGESLKRQAERLLTVVDSLDEDRRALEQA